MALENARLYELATVDGLTGLYVRRYFDSRLKEELERSRRFDTSFSVVLLDIDDFKKLNDTHGHVVGDRVLREVAQAVRSSMRGVDIAARYGGEEFAFILPRTAIVDAHAAAERIRQDVADARVAYEGNPVGDGVARSLLLPGERRRGPGVGHPARRCRPVPRQGDGQEPRRAVLARGAEVRRLRPVP